MEALNWEQRLVDEEGKKWDRYGLRFNHDDYLSFFRAELERAAEIIDRHRKCQMQPCGNYKPPEGEDLYSHECPECLGTRGFCQNCSTDHHQGTYGWLGCCATSAAKEIREGMKSK